MPGIFISYRRSDNPDATGRIYDRLVSEFGKARVFKDVDSIPLGQDFRGHLNGIVGDCAAVLAIIGPRWSDFRNEAGQRRLEDPDDFVRIELEAALTRDIPVVPVLVAHASLPGTSMLPSTLATLAYRQSIEVRPDPDFHNDATRLVAALRKILDPNTPEEVVRKEDASSLVTAATNVRKGTPWLIAALAAAIVLAAALAFPALKHLRETPPLEVRTEISTPEMDRPQDIALSPDGRQIVFAARDGNNIRLWLRPLDSETARPLQGTEGAADPFWSPDSASIAFFTSEGLKRFDLAGGLTRVIEARRFDGTGGGSWSDKGVILFATGPGSPIMRIPAAGGESVPVTQPEKSPALHVGPYFVADGRRFLYTEIGAADGPGAIYLGSIDGGAPVRLAAAGNRGTWLPSGWLVWEQNGSLLAQRLDLDKASLTGETVTIADRTLAYAGRPVSVANNGLIAIPRGGRNLMQLRWFDRSGASLGTVGNILDSVSSPRVAPDGRRVAMSRSVAAQSSSMDIWLIDPPRTGRFTFERAIDEYPVWSPDGAQVVFSSLRPGSVFNLYRKASSGAGADEPLVTSDQHKVATSWSADGRFLMYFASDAKTGTDLWIIRMSGDRKPFVFRKTSFDERWGQFSPDGRWVAYVSNESGQNEIWVRPFDPSAEAGTNPGGAGGQWQVSEDGGVFPAWRPDGTEIYYLNPAGMMMAAPFTIAGSTAVPGAPVQLFETRIVGGGTDNRQTRQYDVAPDGRFLVNVLDDNAARQITLIQNWNPEAKSSPR